MKFLNTIALSAVAAVIAAPLTAEAKVKHHHAAAAQGASTAAELKSAQAEITELQARLNSLEARIDSQGNAQQAAASQAANQAEAATQLASTASAKADQAAVTAQVAQTQATSANKGLDLVKWAKNTQITGRMFFNESHIDQHTNGLRNAQTGTGFNVKRVYIGVDHQFSPIFAASLLMDISNVIGESAETNFVTPTVTASAPVCTTTVTAGTLVAKTTCVAGAATNLAGSPNVIGKGFYVKNAFVQAKLNPALIIRAGAAPLPWVPYIENQYGFRHIEHETLDRLGYGTTADWGIHVLGDLAHGLFSYQLSAIDGAGYRNVRVTKTVDLEGRVSAQYDGFWAAIGGYTGKRGNDTQTLTGAAFPTTFRTAKRADVGAGYKNAVFNVGGEAFYAKNWNNVTVNPATTAFSQDSARGYSAFGNVNLTPKWTVFGRYDFNQPNYITDRALHDHYFNVGLQWEPVKIVDLALVYKRETVRNGSVATSSGVIGCGTGATPNFDTSAAVQTTNNCIGNGTYDEFGLWGQFKF